MTNKEYLQRAYKIYKRLKSKKIRLLVLQEQAAGTSLNLSKLPRCIGVLSKTEELAVKIVDLQESIHSDEESLAEVRKEIKEAIYRLQNETLITILDMRYLQYMSWEDIITQTDYCQSHVFRLHGEALQMVQQPNESK